MRSKSMKAGAVSALAVLVLAGCAGHRGEVAENDVTHEEPVVVTKLAPRPVTAAAPAAPIEWEAWPPADAVNLPREAPTGEMIELKSPPGGMPFLELAALVSEKTGAVIAYDPVGNQKLRTTRFEWAGTWRVQTSRLIDALRSILATSNQVIMPMSLGGDGAGYMIYDQNNPLMKMGVEWVPESRVLGYEHADGKYIVTVLRVRDMVDTVRLRQALTSQTTQIASIGRIQDVPGGRGIVVSDFAPVVAAMKRIVDEVNRTAVPPGAPGGVPPTPTR
ncbi:MAG: hypothetical protein K8T90_11680 [Planctomycetes bacterium]|nr:hypothetical protein [Planctomycetota bacterium]